MSCGLAKPVRRVRVTRSWQPGPRRQHGIALLTAIILVAIATILATAIAWQNSLNARRGIAVFTVAQGFALAQGGEAFAAYVLRDNRAKNPSLVLPTQQWAMPYGPLELDAGAVFDASLEDQGSKFNLNNLVTQSALGAPFVKDQFSADQFSHLLELLDIDRQYTARVIDWIDRDDQPDPSGGAEDGYYLALAPAHRVPNMLITSVSELLAMGMDRASYDRLKPFVTALPAGTPLNLCTALPEVLDAYLPGSRSFTVDPRQFANLRQQGTCYPDQNTFLGSLPAAAAAQFTGRIGTTSQFFRLRAWVTIGTTRFTLYSLLQQDTNGQIRPLLRTFGTE